nr:hypothetical protein [uncultured Desulfobacter sp.]
MKLLRNSALAFCLVLSVCLFAPAAGAVVIDFENLAHDGDDTGDYFSTYTEDGFILNSYYDNELSEDLTVFGTATGNAYAGSTMLMNDGWDPLTVLTAKNGATFTLNAISLCELSIANTESYTITFTGVLSDGNTVTQNLTLDGTFGIATYSFGSNFTDLVSVNWDAGDYGVQFDNINASSSPVPVPSAVLLMFSGFICLAGLKRTSCLK